MSLFKTRDFWSTHSEDDEYFDKNSLVVTQLNSDSDFIITGSQSGVLRIFKPSCELTENNNLQGFSAGDLLIEKIFNYPILQVGCGRLVSASQSLQLAVLHPKLLSVYTLKSKEGITEHGTQNYLERLYDHNLLRSAANFVIGPFGGTQNRDFLCVQSLDGMLSFFEQENSSFSCSLPDFLLPGPIAYVRKTDSFVTSSSNWYVVSYKYKFLSEIGEKSELETSRPIITTDWTFNLGEPILDILEIDDFINKEAWIMVLGERNLYCLNNSGKLKFMKRLEYSPMCFNTHVIDDNIFSLVVSETSTLLIYENTTLKWSAQLHFLPVTIARTFLKKIKGVLVLLSEEGRLECCYLGTEPSLFVAPPVTSKKLDFDKAEEELTRMNKIIKKSYGSDMKATVVDLEKELVQASINSDLETCTFENNVEDIEQNQMCPITIEILPHIMLEEVQVIVSVQRPLKVTPGVQYFTNLNEKVSFTSYVYLYENIEVSSLNVDVIVTIISDSGFPKMIEKTLTLPMKLVLQCCQAQKESEHKITLNISQSPVSLATLFPEYINDDSSIQSSNAIAFRSVTGAGKPVTILLAKSSERYRLQSDSFASLSLLIELMISRLKKQNVDKSDFKVFYSSPLPANELMLYVNNHFSKRKQVNTLQAELSQLNSQFRIIQKRLVVKYKAKNPTPLTNLNILLDDTYTEIMNVTEKLERENNDLTKAQIELSCALALVRNLIGLMDIETSLKETLESVFCGSVYDVESQAWEDIFEQSLCYLLRTSLAKSEKDKLRAASTSFDEVKDISKVEKHLFQVFERVVKKKKEEKIPKDFSSEEDDPTVEQKPLEMPVKPAGSQFGESSSRLLSARKSLLRRRHKTDEILPNKI